MGLTVTGMADEIEKAMTFEWQNLKGTPLPEAGAEDRHMMCLAISRGILNHLLSQQGALIRDITLNYEHGVDVEYAVNNLTLNISIDE
jgi:hypothetical protein